jgi:hypothetical protein
MPSFLLIEIWRGEEEGLTGLVEWLKRYSAYLASVRL